MTGSETGVPLGLLFQSRDLLQILILLLLGLPQDRLDVGAAVREGGNAQNLLDGFLDLLPPAGCSR